MRWAVLFALALLAGCGSSHNQPPADAGVDSAASDTSVSADAMMDAGSDDGGGLDGGVSYAFTWTSGGEPMWTGFGSRSVRPVPGNVALWLGGSDWLGQGDTTVRVFRGDSSHWDYLGDTSSLTGTPRFSKMADGSATVLATRDVLYAGSGNQDGDRHASDERLYSGQCVIFHQSDQSLTLASPLPARRAFQGDALLPDGRALIIGGVTTPDTPISPPDVLPERFELTIEASTLYYDPTADAWSDGPPLAEARYSPGVTILPGGDVLVVGGFDARNIPLRSVERYHVDTGTWSTVASTTDRRVWHVQALLPSGKVLVAGGVDSLGDAIDSAEVYDPDADSWRAVAPLPLPAALAAGLTLETGDVMVTGGFQDGTTKVAIPQVVAYREGDDTWLALPSLNIGRFYHSAVQLEDGRVLIAAGLRNDTEVMHGANDTEISSVPLR